MKKRYLIISFIAHLLVALLLILRPHGTGNSGHKGGKAGAGRGAGEDRNIIPKAISIDILPLPKGFGVKKPPTKKSPGIKECEKDKWYGGVGIEVNYSDGNIKVRTVYPGYPAYKVGIRAGDELISVGGAPYGELRGDPGTAVVVIAKRDGVATMYTLIREKICTKD